MTDATTAHGDELLDNILLHFGMKAAFETDGRDTGDYEAFMEARAALLAWRDKAVKQAYQNGKGVLESDYHREMHGLNHHYIYPIWQSMKSRCYRPNDRQYKNYGARGIRVCDRWRHSVATFYRDMGDRPSPTHSLDRIDNDRDYEPDNCRWATDIEQINNRRVTVRYLGKTRKEWAKELGAHYPSYVSYSIRHSDAEAVEHYSRRAA